MKNVNNFSIMQRKPSHATTELTLFFLSAKMNGTLNGTQRRKLVHCKSMKNVLYVLRYAKKHLSGRSDVEQ